jgi:hypothetical protein
VICADGCGWLNPICSRIGFNGSRVAIALGLSIIGVGRMLMVGLLFWWLCLETGWGLHAFVCLFFMRFFILFFWACLMVDRML